MKRLLILLALASLACSISSKVPTIPTTPQPTIIKPAPKQPTVQPTAQMVNVIAGSLHVRTEPMGLRVDYLYHGNTVTLTGRCRDGWAQIEWDGAVAWVKAKYLSENRCQKVTGD